MPPGERLLALREDAAYVVMHDGSVAIVINPSKRGRELEEAIRQQLDADRDTHLKLVVTGGGADMRDVLACVQPAELSRRMVQVYHLGADGSVWGGRSSSLDTPVGRALQSATDDTRTIAFEELAARVPRHSPEEIERARGAYAFSRRFRDHRPVFTIALLVGLAVELALQAWWGGSDYMPTLVRMGANMEASLVDEPWRLLASACLHGGEVHLLANGIGVWFLGGLLERIIGWSRLAILVAVAALSGAVMSALLSDAALSVGFSGALFGMLAAAGAIAWRPRGLLPELIVHRLRRAIGVNALLGLGASFIPQVDAWAHLGGALAGAAMFLVGGLGRGLAPLHEGKPKADPKSLRVAGIGAVALVVGALALAIVNGRPWQLVQTPSMVVRALDVYMLEVPEELGEPKAFVVEGGDGIAVGDPLADPVAIVAVAQRREPVDAFVFPEDPEGATRVGERREIADAVVPTFEDRWEYPNGFTQVSRYAFFPDARVMVDVAMLPGTPEPWARAAERTLDSIAAAPR